MVLSSGNQGPYERLLAVIKRLTDQKKARESLSLYLGCGKQYVTNLLSAKFQMPLASFLKIADFLGIPASWLLDRAAPKAPPLPEDQLLLECEDPKLPANTFLDPLLWRLAAVQDLPVEKVDGLHCYRPVLEDLEEEATVDRHSALAKTEELANRLVRDLLTSPASGPLPSRRLGELAASLGLWANLQRSLGLRTLAVKALVEALPLARRSQDRWAYASCLQRASSAIYTLGRPDLACSLLDQAFRNYFEAGAHSEIKRLFVDRGVFLTAFTDSHAESIAAYSYALDVLPKSEWRHRASAFQGLALNYNRLGENEKALDNVLEAMATCSSEAYIFGCAKWRQGIILFDMGQFGAAKVAIREALDLLGRFSNAGDIALVSLDYAEALIRADHLQEANRLIEDVTRWLPELRQNPVLHRALSRFLDLARIGELRLAEVEHTRQTVQEWQNSRQAVALAVR